MGLQSRTLLSDSHTHIKDSKMKNLNGYQMFVSSIFFSGPLSFKKTDIKIASNQSPQSGGGGEGLGFVGFCL